MVRAIQYRRGTTAQHETFTGLPGEITVDMDKKTLCVHDGETPGGFPLAHAGETSSAGSDESKLDTDLGNITPETKQKIITFAIPDYSRPITVSAKVGATYTAPMDGMLFIRLHYTNATVTKIRDTDSNGREIYYCWQQNNNSAQGMLPLHRGQVIYFQEFSSTTELTFYPYTGIEPDDESAD